MQRKLSENRNVRDGFAPIITAYLTAFFFNIFQQAGDIHGLIIKTDAADTGLIFLFQIGAASCRLTK